VCVCVCVCVCVRERACAPACACKTVCLLTCFPKVSGHGPPSGLQAARGVIYNTTSCRTACLAFVAYDAVRLFKCDAAELRHLQRFVLHKHAPAPVHVLLGLNFQATRQTCTCDAAGMEPWYPGLPYPWHKTCTLLRAWAFPAVRTYTAKPSS